MVAEYVGIPMTEVGELDYIDYLVYRRDAFIYNASQTKKGREYLRNAYRLTQTKPDREKLKKFKKR